MFRNHLTAFVVGAALFAAAPASAEIFHQFVITGQTKAERKQIRQTIRALAGRGVSASVDQRGSGNRASLRQRGQGNRAFIGQYGDGNAVRVRQRGRNNSAAVVQFGDASDAVVRQRGRGQRALVFVFGAGTMFDPNAWGAQR